MDETALGLYGIGRRRMALVHFMRSQCFNACQALVILLYAVLIAAVFILHDVHIDEIAR